MRLSEWLASGAIGAVREVHNWSSRPFWPQGMLELPRQQPPAPEGFDWDLWLGPVPSRPYHPAYTHAVFRGWYDFGSGALGDMGHYSFYQIFRMLKLGAPVSAEASRSQFWSIQGYTWRKATNHVAYPQASSIHWEFPARNEQPPVTLHWYDGGLRPISELDQWIRACRGGPASDASFENVYPFAETIQLGNVALRADKRLLWDSEKMSFANAPDANELLTRKYREGWAL